MGEVRVQAEGMLNWVRASGTGNNSWVTSSPNPASGLLAFVREFSYTSAITVSTISDRGVPSHHKQQAAPPINVTLRCAWTGQHLTASGNGNGASIGRQHFEFRVARPESNDFVYYQFLNAAQVQAQLNEAAVEDTIQLQFQCLAMNGPTASGYLS